MKRVVVGLLGEYHTPSGERLIERWLPHGMYKRGRYDFVPVRIDALLWINPETYRFWALTVAPEKKARYTQPHQWDWLWSVSQGSAIHEVGSEDRGPWFTDVADAYEEVVENDPQKLVTHLPLRLGMIVHEMMPRFLKLEREYPRSPRRGSDLVW